MSSTGASPPPVGWPDRTRRRRRRESGARGCRGIATVRPAGPGPLEHIVRLIPLTKPGEKRTIRLSVLLIAWGRWAWDDVPPADAQVVAGAGRRRRGLRRRPESHRRLGGRGPATGSDLFRR